MITQQIHNMIFRKKEKRSGDWSAFDLCNTANSGSGVLVNETTALNYSAVFCAVNVYASIVGYLPLQIYKRLPDGGRELAVDHPLFPTLHNSFNPLMTSLVARETMQGHIGTWGNAYAEIQRTSDAGGVNLWPIAPDKVTPRVEGSERMPRLVYDVKDDMGQTVTISADKMVHIPAFGGDGIVGWSPIRQARESIGLSIAAEKFGGSLFGNGAKPSGVLTHPGELGEPALTNLRNSFESKNAGLDNAERPMVLEEGMTWQAMGIPPDDAQFLETRKFQVTEVARWYNLPPHMLKDLERSTFSNIEQQNTDFVQKSLLPVVKRWEQELQRKLLSEIDQRLFFIEYNVEGLLRGDTAARAALYTAMFPLGSLKPDEIRAFENLNPIPGGDKTFVMLNMQPLEDAGEVTEPAAPGGEQNSKKVFEQFRPLFVDAVERILSRESLAVSRARKKLDKGDVHGFEEWYRSFYPKHIIIVEEILTPAVLSFGGDSRDLLAICDRFKFRSQIHFNEMINGNEERRIYSVESQMKIIEDQLT